MLLVYLDSMLTDRDVRYIRSEFCALEVVCREAGREPESVRALMAERWLPGPAYVLPDGTVMVPEDYLDYPDRATFEREYTGDDLEGDLEGYLDGTYFICLRRPTIANILRKTQLVERIRALLAEPRPESEGWRSELRFSVDELDGLERPFSPDHDRVAFGRPPTRDELIAEPRRRYPEVFRGASAPPVSAAAERQ
jgi:uncharacterized protein DUF6058